jgi:MEDS: MEthanogen/methylotroph, DcmR Sensory domain
MQHNHKDTSKSVTLVACRDELPLKQSLYLPIVMRSTSPTGQGFTHHSHGDGTTTSVCNRCPLTVARAIDGTDLVELESRHVCQRIERRQVVRIVHRTYLPAKRASERLGSSGLSQSAKVELIRAHLFLHPCSRCEKSVEHLSPNDERVCFRCQFSLKRRWKTLAPAAPTLPGREEVSRRHEIQLYSSEQSFLDEFTRYIGSALKAGDAVVLVATYLHRGSLFQRLLAGGVDVAAAIDQGRYFPFDAADTVSALMVDDSVDPVRFRKVASDLLMTVKKAARGKQPHVSACGECAPLLWREGKADAAVHLEELWDDIAKAEGLDILCGYPGASFCCEHGSETLHKLLAQHSAVHAQ